MVSMRRTFRNVGLAFLLLLAACAALEPPQAPRVRLADVILLEGGLLEQRMLVALAIANPNNFDLPLEGLAFTLELNDRPLVEGLSNQAVVVPRLGEARLPVQATTSLLNLMRQILALGEDETLSYRLSGRVYVTGFTARGLPFEKTGQLELRPGPEKSLAPI
jgi:LEA14-like dessication related protein